MKFSINQSSLSEALSVVYKGISTRSTLPILSGISIEASDDCLILQTTDLQISIQYTVDALIEEKGAVVVPGKLFFEIIRNLPDAAVSIEKEDESIFITCEASSFSIKTFNKEDFPGFPAVSTNQSIEIPFDIFSSMVKKVGKVVSKDESRAILTGILITMEEKHLKMVATDSYRLAITEADIEQGSGSSFEAVIIGSFLQDIASLPKTKEPVSIALAENQIVIQYQETVFINRRLEGNFPNYRQLLPDGYSTRVELDVGQLQAAVKRISLLNITATPIRFDINKETQTTQLSGVEQDIGKAQETLSCELDGEDTEIAFNYSYILDGLSVVTSDRIFLEIQNSMKPGIFKTSGDENFLYLIMPVRIS